MEDNTSYQKSESTNSNSNSKHPNKYGTFMSYLFLVSTFAAAGIKFMGDGQEFLGQTLSFDSISDEVMCLKAGEQTEFGCKRHFLFQNFERPTFPLKLEKIMDKYSSSAYSWSVSFVSNDPEINSIVATEVVNLDPDNEIVGERQFGGPFDISRTIADIGLQRFIDEQRSDSLAEYLGYSVSVEIPIELIDSVQDRYFDLMSNLEGIYPEEYYEGQVVGVEYTTRVGEQLQSGNVEIEDGLRFYVETSNGEIGIVEVVIGEATTSTGSRTKIGLLNTATVNIDLQGDQLENQALKIQIEQLIGEVVNGEIGE